MDFYKLREWVGTVTGKGDRWGRNKVGRSEPAFLSASTIALPPINLHCAARGRPTLSAAVVLLRGRPSAGCCFVEARDRNSELPRRGPRARASRRTCWPLDTTDGVLGNERGFPALSPRSLDQRLRARSRDSRARARIKRLGRNNRLVGSKGSQGLSRTRARIKRLAGSKGSQDQKALKGF